MLNFRRIPQGHSLSTKLLILSLGWLIIAMTSISLTLQLSWKLEGGAAAINDAGSLRMRTYRTALLLDEGASPARIAGEEQGFSDTLARLRHGDPARPLFLPDNQEVRDQAAQIGLRWQRDVVPLFAQAHGRRAPVTALTAFVGQIDHLVSMIEHDNARNITLLRLFQMILIAIAILGAMVMMTLLFVLVIRPLDHMGEAIQKLRDGDLDSRVKIESRDEFGTIGAGFNQMASRLQNLYATLEQKVRDKTRAVEDKNHQLSALYEVTTFLHDSHDLETTCRGFIQRLIQQVKADAGSVRLIDETRGMLDLVVQSGLPETLANEAACMPVKGCLCGEVVRQPFAVAHHFDPAVEMVRHCHKAGFAGIAVFHIRHNHQDVGIFTLFFRAQRSLSNAEQFLVETLGNHLGVAIENLRLAARERQYAVSEERNLMAQGLHDSIAQSLSFLNLQTQMLERALADGTEAEAQENLAFIRAGVQECYDDVRELLLNFRTRLSSETFPVSIRKLLARFEQQSRVETRLELSGDGPPLDPQQQLQVTFILQEALSNVRKHAHASQVAVTIKNNSDFEMTISDNGSGFEAERTAAMGASHVGLSIMEERARRIHGRILIESHHGSGTTLILSLSKEERLAP